MQPIQPQFRATTGHCLFVYNLPPTTTEDLMYQLFSPYGAVLNVKVIRDISTSLCKGYGFVNYAEYEDAVQVCLPPRPPLMLSPLTVTMAGNPKPEHCRTWW